VAKLKLAPGVINTTSRRPRRLSTSDGWFAFAVRWLFLKTRAEVRAQRPLYVCRFAAVSIGWSRAFRRAAEPGDARLASNCI